MMVEQATDPHYWVRHLRRTVRFADGLAQCLTEGSVVFLEMGPERILSSLILSHPKRTPQHQAFSSLVHRAPSSSDLVEVMTTLGRLWVAGAPVSLPALHEQEKRHRHPLPLYPFERQRYWIEPAQSTPIQEQLPCSLPTEEPDQQEDRKIRDDVHAPVNETQSKVMESFFHVLGYQPQSIHANFFSLGGDSLSALSLLRHLEQAFQRPVALATFLSNPTIEHVAQVLSEAAPHRQSLLVEFQRGDRSRPPLFLLPAVGGNPASYRHLVPLLGKEQPVSSFEERGSDGTSPLPSSIEEMASDYLEAMQSVQPHGP